MHYLDLCFFLEVLRQNADWAAMYHYKQKTLLAFCCFFSRIYVHVNYGLLNLFILNLYNLYKLFSYEGALYALLLWNLYIFCVE